MRLPKSFSAALPTGIVAGAKASEKWPIEMTIAPMTSERRVPSSRSARYPPISGVR
jgi:hypothetical protein